MLQETGGCPANRRVGAEGPGPLGGGGGRGEQEGHPEGLSQEGGALQLWREWLQSGAVHVGSDPPGSLAHRGEGVAQALAGLHAPHTNRPWVPKPGSHSLTSDFHN